MVEQDHNELTQAEAELYDRQIRLWGLENQKRLRAAKILIAGLNGLGAEIAKNIILSGVKSVTFLDSKNVEEIDFCSQFFVPRSGIGKNRAEESLARGQALNPMVEIKIDTDKLTDKTEAFFKQFDVVCILEANQNEQIRINNICRVNNVKFFATDLWGMLGYSFADLQNHEYTEDIIKHKVISAPNEKVKTEAITSTSKRSLVFPSLESVVDFDFNAPDFAKRVKRSGPAYIVMKVLQMFREQEKRDPSPVKREADIQKLLIIRDEYSTADVIPDTYFDHVFGQISPSAAITGGAVAQEIIKAVSQKEAPHHNFFFFDAQTSCGFVESIE